MEWAPCLSKDSGASNTRSTLPTCPPRANPPPQLLTCRLGEPVGEIGLDLVQVRCVFCFVLRKRGWEMVFFPLESGQSHCHPHFGIGFPA